MPRLALPLRVATLLLIAFPAAAASPWTTDIVDDLHDDDPGNGVCLSTDLSNCTLRAAIEEANAFPGPDVIYVTPGTYDLDLGTLAITGDTTIAMTASTVFIDGLDLYRVLDIGGASTLTVDLSDIEIKRGNVTGAGGGIRVRDTDLSLTNVNIRDCASTGDGAGLHSVDSLVFADGGFWERNDSGLTGGAAYFYKSDVILDDLEVRQNTAANFGGGMSFDGDAGANTLAGARLTVDGNVAGLGGGGISVQQGDATFVDTVLKMNTANTAGGGLRVFGSTVTPLVNLHGNSIYSNDAGTNGGGVSVTGATLRASNTTLAENEAVDGAGLYSNGSTVELSSVTAAYNDATGNGGGLYRASGTFRIRHTLLQENTGSIGPNCFGAYASTGFNMTESTSGCSISSGSAFGASSSGDTGTLANYGGSTNNWTVPLLSGPAIDGGDTTCTDPGGGALTTDQRGAGFPRVNGTKCDIGAYED